MKVGVIERYFMSSGGAEGVTLSMLRMLARAGHDTTLYTLRPPAEAPGGVRVEVPGRWRRRPTPPVVRRYSVLCTDHRPLFAMSRGSDVLIVSDWGIFMGPTDARRVLFYFHSQLTPGAGGGALRRCGPDANAYLARPAGPGPGGLRARARALLVRRRIAPFADPRIVLVPNSEYAGRRVERAFGRAAHAAVYPPVDVARLARLRGGGPRAPRAAAVGTFNERKRHGASIRIARAAGVPLDIAGGTLTGAHERVLASLRRGAEGEGDGGPGVSFHPNLGRRRLEGILASARVYLHSSTEDFGISVVEGIAAGCVPIVPNNSAHPETVPFGELRYDTEEEAAEKVRAAAGGEYDSYLPRLQRHADGFSRSARGGRRRTAACRACRGGRKILRVGVPPAHAGPGTGGRSRGRQWQSPPQVCPGRDSRRSRSEILQLDTGRDEGAGSARLGAVTEPYPPAPGALQRRTWRRRPRRSRSRSCDASQSRRARRPCRRTRRAGRARACTGGTPRDQDPR